MVAAAELRSRNVPRRDMETQTDQELRTSLRPIARVSPIICEADRSQDLEDTDDDFPFEL